MNGTIDGGDSVAGTASGHFPHQPVLYQEVLDALVPKSGENYLDGTLGAGGHAEGILISSAPRGRLLGLDLDPEALAIARHRLFNFQDRTIIRLSSFLQAPDILLEIGWQSVDGIILDLGVSSMQVDRSDRGFSFMDDGPLDMRFNQQVGASAADLVNTLSEEELAEVIWKYGEERYSRRIARTIVEKRPIHTTRALAQLIEEAIPKYYGYIHPATRTFQALRIATNQELETLSSALPGMVKCLKPGGRIAVISFHSLEDRITKRFFRRESKDCICPPEQPVCTCGHIASLKILTKKPVRPTEKEIKENPRSSSSRMRVAEKLMNT